MQSAQTPQIVIESGDQEPESEPVDSTKEEAKLKKKGDKKKKFKGDDGDGADLKEEIQMVLLK